MGPTPLSSWAEAHAHFGPRIFVAGRREISTNAAILAATSMVTRPAIPICAGNDSSVKSFLLLLISLILDWQTTLSPMFAIMTVTGADHTGIIAAVTTALAEQDINILDVSQTIMDNWFTMILRVEFDEKLADITSIQERMSTVENSQGLVIRIQSEALFTAVNEI